MLLDEDYEYLKGAGLEIEEDEGQRFLVFKNFPVPKDVYVCAEGNAIDQCEVLFILPENYNASGGDMFWTHPHLRRADGVKIPAVGDGDTRDYGGKVFERWSRHWGHKEWRPKKDKIDKIIDRISWALANPDPNNRCA